MPWTKQQYMLANQVAREAGLSDGKTSGGRDILLRQLDGRALLDGRLSTRAPRLTQADFEWFMAQVEAHQAESQVGIGHKPLGYWRNAQRDGAWKRMRHRADQLGNALAKASGAAYVEGVIAHALNLPHDETARVDLDNCDARQLRKVIDALDTVSKRRSA